MTKWVFTFRYAAILLSLTTGLWSQDSGSISGVVIDDYNQPIPGAVVLYNNVPEYLRDSSGRAFLAGVAINSGTRTGADGAFKIGDLPSGSHYLCASGPAPNQLRSCEWEQPSYRVELSAGESVANVRLRVAEGSLLEFMVRDANGVINDTATGAPVDGRLLLYGGNFRIGVMAGSRYARANLASHSGDLRSYVVAVPKDATVRLFVDSTLRVLGPDRTAVDLGRPSLSIAMAGRPLATVELEAE